MQYDIKVALITHAHTETDGAKHKSKNGWNAN